MDADNKSGKQREEAAVSGRSGLSRPDKSVNLVPETGQDLYLCTKNNFILLQLQTCMILSRGWTRHSPADLGFIISLIPMLYTYK